MLARENFVSNINGYYRRYWLTSLTVDSNFTLDILGNKIPVLPLLRGRQWKAINAAVTIPVSPHNNMLIYTINRMFKLMESAGDTMTKHLPVITFGHVFPYVTT
jgi:hypothetical protein